MSNLEIESTILAIGYERIKFFIDIKEENGVEIFDVDLGDGLIATRIAAVNYSREKEMIYANKGIVHWSKEDFKIVCACLFDGPIMD